MECLEKVFSSFAILSNRENRISWVSREFSAFAIRVISGVSGKLVKSPAAELKVATCFTKFHTEKTT